jgi:NADPH:quinone reductase-like Zn-dependent oxidoreductase
MKAFAIDEFGQLGTVHDLPTPEPGEGEVRVKVAAAALNPFDAFVVKGYMKDRLPHTFPLIPCGDFAGTIDAVGPGVQGLAIGEQVFGTTGRMVMGEGTMAEYTIASAGTLARFPQALSATDAAASPLAGVSGLMCVDAVNPSPGDAVLIVGAGGGVGSFAVQIATARGARVVGVVSSDKVEYVRGLGIAEIVDRSAGAVVADARALAPEGYAGVIDNASDAAGLAELAVLVRDGGHVVSMKGAANQDDLAGRGVTATNIQTMANTDRLTTLSGLYESGKIKPPAVRTFAFKDAGDAFVEIEAGHTRGKLVVTI